MGNSDIFIHKEISKFTIDDKENDKLMELFHEYIINENNQFILKDSLMKILQLSDPDIFEIIFEIFHKKHKRFHKVLYFRHLKKIYYCFKTDDPEIKIKFISLLLFKKDKKIKIKDLTDNIKKIFSNCNLCTYLIKTIIPIAIKSSSNKVEKATKEEDIYYSRNAFKKLCNNQENIKFFTNFHFFNKKYIGASEYNPINNHNLNFVCDCNKKTEIKDNLETMKSGYDSLTSQTKHILYLSDFIKYLKQFDINQKIINLIIDYLKKITEKDFCSYNDIKHIFSNLNYSSNLTDKKKFILKMIFTIFGNDKNDNIVSLKQIYEYLDLNSLNEKNIEEKEIENNDEINTDSQNLNENENESEINDYNNIDEIDTKNLNDIKNIDEKNSEMKDDDILFKEDDIGKIQNDILDNIFLKLMPSLEILSLVPYLLFKAKTNDKSIKRKLIKYILKMKNIDNFETYLKDHFNVCKYFYAVDINFWNALMDENMEVPDYLNNSRIAEEISIITEKQKFDKEEYEEKLKENEEMAKKEKNKKKKKKKK